MSVETAGAIGAAVAAPAASIGAEISTISSIGPSMGPELSQSFSSIPGPEIPSSIITEIPRPTGMEFESIPEQLVGDFDIHDIIAQPYVEEPLGRSFQTEVDPATFLDPKIVERINAPSAVATEVQAESVTKPEIFEPDPITQIEEIVKEAKSELIPQVLDQPTFENAIETTQEILTPADQEVGTLAGAILTLGAVEPKEIPQIESQSDVQTLKRALALLATSGFTQEKEALWKTKLEKVVETQAIIQIKEEIDTQVETDAQSAVETVADIETESATAGGSQPPDLPTTEDGEFEMKKPEDEIEEEEDAPEWDVYHIADTWQNASKVNKRRAELAEEIAFRAAQEDRPILEARAEIYKLDVPDVKETIQMLQGKLKKPAIAHEVYAALGTVNEKDQKAVGKAIIETVRRNASVEAKPTVTATERVKESKLPPEVQELAAGGAREVLWKKNRWQRGKVIFQNPIEAKKVQQKKAA
ncbi:MAG: hypothetical protein Q8P25_02200 [Candidatus Curtissbacteria bacterium]|nr:hypothetical protein [Candidatus Curtissbacteria bacterium]